jgi:hypothetical protein
MTWRDKLELVFAFKLGQRLYAGHREPAAPWLQVVI